MIFTYLSNLSIVCVEQSKSFTNADHETF